MTLDPKIKEFCEMYANEIVANEIKIDISVIRNRLNDVERKIDEGYAFFNSFGEFQTRASTVPLDLKLVQYAQAKQFCDQFEL